MHTNLVCALHTRYFTHERNALAPSHVRTRTIYGQRRKRKKEKNASLHAFISAFLFNRKEIAHTRISKVHTRTHWRGLSSKQPLFQTYKIRCLLRQLPNFRLSRAHTHSLASQRRSAHRKCVRSPIQWQRKCVCSHRSSSLIVRVRKIECVFTDSLSSTILCVCCSRPKHAKDAWWMSASLAAILPTLCARGFMQYTTERKTGTVVSEPYRGVSSNCVRLCVCVYWVCWALRPTISLYLVRFECIRMCAASTWSERTMLIHFIYPLRHRANDMGMVEECVSNSMVLARCFSPLPYLSLAASHAICKCLSVSPRIVAVCVYLHRCVSVIRCVPFFNTLVRTYFPFAWAHLCECVHGVLRNFYVIDNFLVFLKAVRIEVLLCKDGNKKHWCNKVQYVLFITKCGITTSIRHSNNLYKFFSTDWRTTPILRRISVIYGNLQFLKGTFL